MSDQEQFDVRLAARFEQEHGQVPGDSFVAATMQKVGAARRRNEVVRWSVRAAALVMAFAASPWLIAGAGRLNAALESSLSWTMGTPGAWALLALTVVVVVAARLRRW